MFTVKPQIKDTPKEDRPPNKGQTESTLAYTLYGKSPLKEDNLSTKRTKRLIPKVSLLSSTIFTCLFVQEVILTSLLQDTADCSCLTPAPTHLNSLDTVRRTILDWLLTVVASQTAKSDSRAQDIQEEDVTDIADTLWHSDHSKLLAQVSARYLDFFKAYFQMLATRTREIEKRRLESCILQTSDVEPNEEIPLSQRIEWATCHWVELAQAGAHLKDICEAFLLKETQQPISEAESTYWTMSMRVTVSRESLWYKLLAAMHSVHQI